MLVELRGYPVFCTSFTCMLGKVKITFIPSQRHWLQLNLKLFVFNSPLTPLSLSVLVSFVPFNFRYGLALKSFTSEIICMFTEKKNVFLIFKVSSHSHSHRIIISKDICNQCFMVGFKGKSLSPLWSIKLEP